MRKEGIPCACTIAGSDSGGGAGIQADLKTFTALGVWGITVITAITAQHPGAVKGVWPLPPEAVAAQMEAVAEGFPIRAYKTGMLANREIILTVAAHLPDGIPLVVDPVMVATSGGILMERGARDALVGSLLPRATIVTPNLAEAAALAGSGLITTEEAMRAAAGQILELGPQAVIVKGGHLVSREAVDLLVDRDGELLLRGERYPYDVHGSGCSFSAALAAFLARGEPVRDAAVHAKAFIGPALRDAFASSRGPPSVNPFAGGRDERGQ
ncbi:MAG: bifunctional hydroxymethylpyrimidine kinase/phosphomethylpyrimidine kinase [Methanomicrobiales archaeon]|nr:bifunctional hydroxymethylpyrimidine kinase/phosphomethylpyrimidine kinase [Methanomicrobiales archaeon]